MARVFVIEALEPRQLLSGSVAPTVQPVGATSATACSTTIAGAATSSASVSTSSTATLTTGASADTTTSTATTTTAGKSFVRPGDSSTNDDTPTGSKFTWGTDIYPPPVFNGSGGKTARTTVTVGPAPPPGLSSAGSTGTTSSTTPITPITTGKHVGKSSVPKHFQVHPNEVFGGGGGGSSTGGTGAGTTGHSGRAASVGSMPQVVSPSIQRPSPRSVGNTFVVVSYPALVSAPSHSVFPTIRQTVAGQTLLPTLGLSNGGSSIVPAKPTSVMAGHVISGGVPAKPTDFSSAVSVPASAAQRVLRYLPQSDFAGLLLPLATLETGPIAASGGGVSKWEVDLALGSLVVVIAGYWYLCDAAAHRRRQRAQAVAVFCAKPID